MRYRGIGATILALAVLLAWIATAEADILDTSDGIRLPKKDEIKTPWGEFPRDEELKESGKNNLDLNYEEFDIGKVRGPAGQVARIYITEAITGNVEFQAAETHAERGFWMEASQAFRAAAESLSGLAKEVALYKCMVATANTNDPESTLRAADALLAANPKGYYFGPAQETRARAFATLGRMNDATAALQLVLEAPRMNVRDYFSAAYLKAWLTTYIGARSKEQFATAEKAFKDLLTELDRRPQKELATVPRLRILMSLAASIRNQGRSDEAKGMYQQILKAAGETTDASVLAGVYYGLGDVAFEEASALQSRAAGAPELKKQVRDMLDQAALHYLRVLLLYKDAADQREVYGATQGAARVFATIFTVSNEQDCEAASRAYDYYRQAVDMQPSGEMRRQLVREGRALKKRMDEVCKEGGGEGGTTIEDDEDK